MTKSVYNSKQKSSSQLVMKLSTANQKLVPKPVIEAVSSNQVKPVLLQDSGDKLTKLQEKGRNVFVWPSCVNACVMQYSYLV